MTKKESDVSDGICRLGDSGDFKTSRYQGIVKATVSGWFEDLKFKISEGSDQNWSCPESSLLAVSAKIAHVFLTLEVQNNNKNLLNGQNFGPQF